MSKNSAQIDVAYPIYGLRFLDNKTILTAGGGGEGNNGIPNKITAIRCSFNIADKDRRLQKFREITLPANEDSPMCVDACRFHGDFLSPFHIFVGCNQLTQLIKSMGINNNLRKYQFTDDEHLKFLDAVQFDQEVLPETLGEFPKIVQLSANAGVGALMTSRVPSEIFVFEPKQLGITLHYKPAVSSEIKDFHLNPFNDGELLCYVTASSIQVISTKDGTVRYSSTQGGKNSLKIAIKYFFSKVRYVDGSRILITGSLRSGKGAGVIVFDLSSNKVVREKVVSKKMKGIVALDVTKAGNLAAVAGNDFSVTLIQVPSLKIVQAYPNLHKFAITSLSFSPNGKRLATGSASNTLCVLPIAQKSGGSFFGTLFKWLFLTIFVALAAVAVQVGREANDMDEVVAVSARKAAEAIVYSNHYKDIAVSLSKEYGDVYFKVAKQHGGIYWDQAKIYGELYFKLALEYGKAGLELLKEKFLEALVLLKEQIDKQSAKSATVIDVQSTLNDVVSQVTKNVDKLTSLADIDTDSVISEAVDHVTVIAATVSEAVSSVADTVTKSAAEVVDDVVSAASASSESAASSVRDAASSVTSAASNVAEDAARAVSEVVSSPSDSESENVSSDISPQEDTSSQVADTTSTEVPDQSTAATESEQHSGSTTVSDETDSAEVSESVATTIPTHSNSSPEISSSLEEIESGSSPLSDIAEPAADVSSVAPLPLPLPESTALLASALASASASALPIDGDESQNVAPEVVEHVVDDYRSASTSGVATPSLDSAVEPSQDVGEDSTSQQPISESTPPSSEPSSETPGSSEPLSVVSESARSEILSEEVDHEITIASSEPTSLDVAFEETTVPNVIQDVEEAIAAAEAESTKLKVLNEVHDSTSIVEVPSSNIDIDDQVDDEVVSESSATSNISEEAASLQPGEESSPSLHGTVSTETTEIATTESEAPPSPETVPLSDKTSDSTEVTSSLSHASESASPSSSTEAEILDSSDAGTIPGPTEPENPKIEDSSVASVEVDNKSQSEPQEPILAEPAAPVIPVAPTGEAKAEAHDEL